MSTWTVTLTDDERDTLGKAMRALVRSHETIKATRPADYDRTAHARAAAALIALNDATQQPTFGAPIPADLQGPSLKRMPTFGGRWAKVCQSCWEQGEPGQYFPDATTYDQCAVCGEEPTLVTSAHPEVARAAWTAINA